MADGILCCNVARGSGITCMSIFKMEDLRIFEFYGSNIGLLEKPMYDFL